MAGVKGRSGGPRPGSGRPPSEFTPPEAHDDSLDFLRSVMTDLSQKPELRVRAAITLAQYEHAKVSDIGKKGEKQEAAKEASKGKFGAAKPPKLSAVK